MDNPLTNSITEKTEQLTTIPLAKRARQRLLRDYPGVLAAVARKLQSRRSGLRSGSGFVNRVFHHQATSAKVYGAILDGFNQRIQAQHTVESTEANG